MISLTDRAAQEIERIMVEQDIEIPKLRFGVQGGGCSGLKYLFEFCTITDEFDTTFVKKRDKGDISIIVDKKSFFFAPDITVDFNESLMDRGFVFNNPAATTSCGCGESFGV
jgi:iron-sulfur cluster assembly protein